jgi:hypothetical protein
LASHPVIGIGGVEEGGLDQVEKSRESGEGTGLGTVGVDDVGLEFLNERMETGPGAKVTQLRGVGDAEVADRSTPGNNPLYQLGETLASADVGIGKGDLLTGLMKKIGQAFHMPKDARPPGLTNQKDA